MTTEDTATELTAFLWEGELSNSGTQWEDTLAFPDSQLCRDGTIRRQSMSQTDGLAMQAGSGTGAWCKMDGGLVDGNAPRGRGCDTPGEIQADCEKPEGLFRLRLC